MKQVVRLGVVGALVVVVVVLAGARLQAWNPATHIYIAQKVYPAYAQAPQLWYGAMAPDLSMYVPDPNAWSTAFWDTHWIAPDLRPWARTNAQRTFARGWITHNEMYGADHYAHGLPPYYLAGYVTLRANLLAKAATISPDLAHYAVETAVDILMQTRHPELADELMGAVPESPTLVDGLLARVFAWWPLRRTDAATLASAEYAFGNVIQGTPSLPGYAIALKYSTVQDYEAMVAVGVQLQQQMGLPPDPDQVRALLAASIGMCGDYETAINLTIKAVSRVVPR